MTRLLPFAGIAVALLLSACSAPQDTPETEVVRPVLTTVATLVSSQTIGPFVGTIQSRQQTAMGFQLSGRVLTRQAGVGDLVKQGQVLATLDSSVQEFQLSTAQANLASAQAQFNNLRAAETRMAQLVSSNTAAQAQLDAATTARQTAQAQLDQAKANVASAQDQLDYTRIVAGSDAVVVSTAAEVGQVVSAGETVLVLAQPEQREAVFDLPETLAAVLKVGDPVAVSAVSGDSAPIIASVRDIAPSASATARLRRVRVTLDGQNAGFRLGSPVEANISRALAAPEIEIPLTAIYGTGADTSVWIVDPASATVSRHTVTVSAQASGLASISSGLSQGEIVVTAGVNSLTEGQSVLLSQGNAE